MGAAIAVENGDAHLRHDLRQAEVEGMKHVGFAFFRVEIARRLKRQPGADRACSVAKDDRGMVQVAAIARFYCQAGLGANPGIDQGVMHGSGRQGHGDGNEARRGRLAGRWRDR